MQNKRYKHFQLQPTLGLLKIIWKLKRETGLIVKLRIPVKSQTTPIFCDCSVHISVISLTLLLAWLLAKPHQIDIVKTSTKAMKVFKREQQQNC